MADLDLTEAIEAAKIGQPAPFFHDVIEAAVRAAAPTIERAVREQAEAKIKYLTDEMEFWKEQQKLAANVAATIADLDEVAPALRQLLRAETKRRRQAEDEVDRLLALVPTEAADA